MPTRIIINTDKPEAKAFLEYARKLDFVTVYSESAQNKETYFPKAELPALTKAELHRKVEASLYGENATNEEVELFFEKWK